MRKLIPILLRLILILCITSCEKDDICVDSDTPSLVIRFYDSEDETSFKSVTNLRVSGVGAGTTITDLDRVTTDSIVIPLKSFENTVSFVLINESADDTNGMETGNSDTIILNYIPKEVFVSRACGYITNFDELNASVTDDVDTWITNITVENASITNENSAHVKIFH